MIAGRKTPENFDELVSVVHPCRRALTQALGKQFQLERTQELYSAASPVSPAAATAVEEAEFF